MKNFAKELLLDSYFDLLEFVRQEEVPGFSLNILTKMSGYDVKRSESTK